MELSEKQFELWDKLDLDFQKKLKDGFHLNFNKCFANNKIDISGFTTYCNYRIPYHGAYFLINFLKNKHICHIGSKNGDLELLWSQHAKKITMIEINHTNFNNLLKKKSQYKCPVDIICNDFKKENINADVYYLWTGSQDEKLVKYIMEKYPGKTIIVAYFSFEEIKNLKNQNIKVRNFLVPFDERDFKLPYPNNSPAGKYGEYQYLQKDWGRAGLYGYTLFTIIN